MIRDVTVTSLPPIPVGSRFAGYIHGLAGDHKLSVGLETSESVYESTVDTNGAFSFTSDIPDGQYRLSVSSGSAYFTEPARRIDIDPSNSECETQIVLLRARPMVPRENGSTYVWKQDGTVGGHVLMSDIPDHLEPRLESKYNVILTDDSSRRLQDNIDNDMVEFAKNDQPTSMKWTRDYAVRLFQTLEKIPKTNSLQKLKWHLTSEHVNDDIEFDDKKVVISVDVFKHAKPLVVDRPSESFFSRKLYMACVRFVIDNVIAETNSQNETEESRRLVQLAHILDKRFGVEVSTSNIRYMELTKSTTGGEDSEYFQAFHATELLSIVAMLEEMPEGLHKLENLKTLVRRKTSRPHPLYPSAAAVAWPFENANYIEFMDKSFTSNLEDTFRLILHEKGHFIYADSKLFPESAKEAWNTIGKWSKLPDGKWTTSEEETFVSAYAHLKNPNEDFAESLAAYIRQPKHLKRRAPEKYKFIQDHIVKGVRYETRHREDLTFQVLNLWPNEDAPGKIDRIHINVAGQPKEDKMVQITITLKNDVNRDDTAKSIYLRLRHSTEPVFKDMHFRPAPRTGGARPPSSHELVGRVELSKYAPKGDWTTDQIIITDAVGNQRYVRVTNYGWQCNLNNQLEDRVPPVYKGNTLQHQLSIIGQSQSQLLTITWDVEEKYMIKPHHAACYVTLIPPKHEKGTQFYGISKWDTNVVPLSGDLFRCTVAFNIPNFYQNGIYEIGVLAMHDLAGYKVTQTFHSEDAKDKQGRYQEPPKKFSISTAKPDNEPPEIKPTSIKISAKPTNIDAPNGETEVSFSVDIRDQGIAGVDIITYFFMNPDDQLVQGFIDHSNKGTPTFEGNPEEYKTYSKTHLLPVGSQQGTWALHSLEIYDKARNVKNYIFVEVVRSSSPSENQLHVTPELTDTEKEGSVGANVVKKENMFIKKEFGVRHESS
eukprot:GEMP01004978.1.p1 GENE.GEMP01004978.1~~GEMP01004978.1.p1  ORF type:complete len:937 (+),score=134.54 GEMP01004978.1:333-3143(+)